MDGTGDANEMTRKTNYHEWTIPTGDADAEVWRTLLSELIDGPLEASVALRGPFEERPTDAPPDAIYHATGRNEYYRFDADRGEWIDVFAHADEARKRYADARGATAAYQRVGAGSLDQIYHTQQIVGTRHLAGIWPMVPRSGPAGEWSYTHSGANDERTQTVNYGMLEQPPNMIPILKAYPVLSTPEGEFEIGVQLGTQHDDDYLMTFRVGPDTEKHSLYGEVRLDEIAESSITRPYGITDSTFEVRAGIDGSTMGTIHGRSSLAFEWEVL